MTPSLILAAVPVGALALILRRRDDGHSMLLSWAESIGTLFIVVACLVPALAAACEQFFPNVRRDYAWRIAMHRGGGK